MIFTSNHFPMNTHKYPLRIILAGIALSLIAETAMAFFFNKVLEANEFLEVLNELPQGAISDRQVKRITLENQELPNNSLANIHFKSCKWHGLDAHEKSLKNIIFEDCEFNNVDMRNATLENIQFLNSHLNNVVMNQAHLTQIKFTNSKLTNSDPNILNGYRDMIADELKFDRTELTGINFFGSKAILRFNECTLYNVSGVGLLAGSALYFNKTKGSILDFDQSDLSTIEIIDSTIDKRSTAGGGQVKTIRVENSKLEFAVTDNSNVDSISFKGSGEVTVGGGKQVRRTNIESCPSGTHTVLAGSNGFDSVKVENCQNLGALFFADSVGKTVIIKNVTTHDMDFRESNIEHLVLENVQVRSYIEYTKTQVKDLTLKNVSFRKGIEIYKEGSNIEITPDSWVEE